MSWICYSCSTDTVCKLSLNILCSHSENSIAPKKTNLWLWLEDNFFHLQQGATQRCIVVDPTEVWYEVMRLVLDVPDLAQFSRVSWRHRSCLAFWCGRKLQSGPLPLLSGVIPPLIGVIIPVTHLYGHL